MDIDEFLDREFSGLDLSADKAEKDEQIGLPQVKGEFEASPLFENIKASLSKGRLEQAEQAYVQLWHILLQQKLKWDKELYEQLAMLSRQFSGALNSASNEIKKKSEHIYEMISRARAALKEGKKELPFKIYSEIEEISNSVPSVFFEEKRIIEEQVMDFYKELKNTTDNELVKRVSVLVQEVNRLIDKISLAIRSNDMTNAIVNYNKCIELYNQVPEGFLKHKNQAGMRILELYKSISIQAEISSLQQQLSQKAVQQQFQPQQQARQQFQPGLPMQAVQQPNIPKSALLNAKKERAKRNIEKGFYNEAYKDIEEALQLEPNDAEAKALNAKIKTLQ
ncbi:hypothetical protein HYY71_01910 [Candidatus Woesearchaeota archaeon]|nr:hypothetical protein [Candidatus Woesearchaeota archaeon]